MCSYDISSICFNISFVWFLFTWLSLILSLRISLAFSHSIFLSFHHTTLYNTTLYHTTLYHTTLHHTQLYNTTLHHTTLYHTTINHNTFYDTTSNCVTWHHFISLSFTSNRYLMRSSRCVWAFWMDSTFAFSPVSTDFILHFNLLSVSLYFLFYFIFTSMSIIKLLSYFIHFVCFKF